MRVNERFSTSSSRAIGAFESSSKGSIRSVKKFFTANFDEKSTM